MAEENKQDRSFELRSEKVRSIVGQIPPVLVRYGMIIIFVVLMLLLAITYFIPYKQVYSGTITFYEVAERSTTAYIRFSNDKSLAEITKPLPLTLHTNGDDYTITLISIVNERDTLNRYPATVQGYEDIVNLKNRSYDFTIVESSENILSHFISIK